MSGLILWLMSGAGQVVAAVIAGGAVLLGIYAKGRSSARRDARAEAAEDNIATRRRMDDALDGLDGNDPDAARRFLRERGKRPGDL